MRDEDVKRYLHPKETRYFPLAVFAGAPFGIFFILMTIASFGIFALLAVGVLCLVWVSVRMFRARLLGYAAKVDEHNFPSLHAMLAEIKQTLDYDGKVEMFVVEEGSFNSLLVPLFRHKFIVLHAGMLSKEVSRQEVKWMIARFVGSLKAKSCRLSLIQAMIAASEKFVIFNLLFYPYERAVVLSGDRLGLGVIGGDLRSAMIAMNRLCVGVHCGPYLSTHGMVRQREELRGVFAFFVRMLSKHPPLPHRYEALLTFAREAYPRNYAEFTGTTAREPAPRLSGFTPVVEAAE
jgi:hypothetical protein